MTGLAKRWLLPVGIAVAALAAAAVVGLPRLAADAPQITVYKSPTCGCCTKWIDHLEDNGFSVVAEDVPDLTPIMARYGVPEELASCHTAVVDGYVVEGHVPADLIHRFLAERSGASGLAVPGMPMGSPGMEGPYKDPYDVLVFHRDGRTTVYARR